MKTSNDIILKDALKRKEIFTNLGKYLETIKEVVHKMDPDAEVFLFGSVAENTHTLSSDIDVLVVTRLEPARVYFELWKSGIKDPFEIHVQPPEKVILYQRRAKLVKI